MTLTGEDATQKARCFIIRKSHPGPGLPETLLESQKTMQLKSSQIGFTALLKCTASSNFL
jgi:hypothetical protein